MYSELISSFLNEHSWARLEKPCTDSKILEAENYVGFSFPEDLKNLLRETDGDHWFLLSADQIIEHVKINREIFPEFLETDEFEEKINRHIFFATNGCGDYFCYRILQNGKTDSSAIYIWEHELFETRKVAKDISDLIIKYYTNEIS